MSASPLHSPHWGEGLLLCPQHLQHATRYHEALLDARLRALHPAPWGVEDLAFDPAALAAGDLKLTRLRATFPDGTVIDLAATGLAPPPIRRIAPHFPPSAALLPVYLALPELHSDAPNVDPGGASTQALGLDPGVTQAAPSPRFRRLTRPLTDLSSGADPRPIDLLVPTPLILFGSEPLDGHVLLPIAELRRAPDGAVVVVDAFIPPLLALTASAALRAALADLFAQALARWRALRSECHRRRVGLTDLDPRDLGRLLLLQALGRALPRLAQIVDAPTASPRDAFDALLALAGELAAFTSEGDLAALPRYRHDDLRATFGPLLAGLRAQIHAALRVDYIDLALAPQGDGLWVAELTDDRLRRCSAVFLALAPQGAEHLAPEGVAELVKVAAWRRIHALVRGNSRGAPLRPARRPSAVLPLADDDLCFTIDARDPHWREVLEERSLAVHLSAPCDPRRARLRAFGVPPRGSPSDSDPHAP